MAEVSTRARRVGDQIRRELAELIAREVADPRVRGVLISEVEVSRDLAHATVHVVCPADADTAQAIAGLASASGFLRRHIAKAVRLRHVPQLHFRLDSSLDNAAHIDALITRALRPGSGSGSSDEEEQ